MNKTMMKHTATSWKLSALERERGGIMRLLPIILILVSCLIGTNCYAEVLPNGIDTERLANAIYKAEGGAKTRHLYGILAKYKHTTPRQACINTINSKYRDYLLLQARGKPTKEGYLRYLSGKYAPENASNDPRGLNSNWLANVSYFYNQRKIHANIL